ncbi:cell wall assembly/cell proliferation coordinating protein [Gammaproteobacteria bacterium 53_120_T64]|nr:cell wall assembly/cell proliferation coordinating protein [Gammaproteobacteria bacterium 53_120_T64]
MSIEKIEKAGWIMEKSGEEILSCGGASDELITATERLLGELPDDYKYFLKKYGALSFEAEEFYGITKSGLEGQSVPCVIFCTQVARERGDISKDMIKIKSSGYGQSFSIDISQINKDGAAPVVETEISYKHDGNKSVIANSFSEFLLAEIQNSVDEL